MTQAAEAGTTIETHSPAAPAALSGFRFNEEAAAC